MQPFPEVESLRQASRQIIRELGFLEHRSAAARVTHSQCHALIEIGRTDGLGVAELATRLNLDKSTLSRTVAQLLRARLVTSSATPEDLRKKPLRLTASGRRKLESINQLARAQVHAALDLLDEQQRGVVLSGMALYARALTRLRGRQAITIRAVAKKDDAQLAEIIGAVRPELGAVGPEFPILDAEIDCISEWYPPPRATYFVLEERGGRLLGGGGFGPLAGADEDICEVRKMYFLPEVRGLGLGRTLLGRILDGARAAGYRTAYLETLERMVTARALYESFAFKRLHKPEGATGHFGCNAWYARTL